MRKVLHGQEVTMKTEENRYWLAGGEKRIPTITYAAYKFLFEHHRLIGFMAFANDAIGSFFSRPDHESNRFHKYYTSALEDTMLQELVLTRTVDNFLCFLTDLLSLIYETKPEMLTSSEQERLDFILQFNDMDSLRSAIAEKKVERLSYKGLKEVAKHIESNMGFQLFENPSDLEEAALIVEMRNICVHARGRVGKVSIERFPSLSPLLGEKLDLSEESVARRRAFLEDCVIDIDVRATAKFGLFCQSVDHA